MAVGSSARSTTRQPATPSSAERVAAPTAAEAARAPFELTGPVLRLSPHVDATVEDLEQVVAALTALTPGSSGNTPTPRS
jgi:hypothetical protein